MPALVPDVTPAVPLTTPRGTRGLVHLRDGKVWGAARELRCARLQLSASPMPLGSATLAMHATTDGPSPCWTTGSQRLWPGQRERRVRLPRQVMLDVSVGTALVLPLAAQRAARVAAGACLPGD
eukprot:7383955-Prymnesium_polylepis.1